MNDSTLREEGRGRASTLDERRSASSAIRRGAALCAALMALHVPMPAFAWKPTTHVFLAERAIGDALDDGRVSIPDLATGTVRTYAVSPQTREALLRSRAHYRAGVLGPDAYPDILTGQQYIHPAESDSAVPGGSEPWLRHVWGSFGTNPAERAFRLGFLTHVAGDVYGHTFINHFTGEPFTFDPPLNAIKHVVLEGYVDKRMPTMGLGADVFQTSIAGLEPAIYRAMIDARPGSRIDRQLLPRSGAGARFSIPRVFSSMRADLQRDIDAYYREKSRLQRAIADCAPLDFSCSAVALSARLTAYVAANGLIVTYKEHWRDDIDSGLRAWPRTSHEVALALFYNPQRTADTARADEILTRYVQRHLLSMLGAPDFVGLTAEAIDRVTDAIIPDALLEPIRRLKEDMLNALLMEAIGMNKDQLEAYLTRPDRYFDQMMTQGAGERVTLSRFNREYLGLTDLGFANPREAFDVEALPAAYNTVVLSKLILLDPPEIDRLIRDLGGSQTLSQPNVMLGWVPTLDGSRQWQSGFALARDCAVYTRVFKPLPGPGRCLTSPDPTPAPAGLSFREDCLPHDPSRLAVRQVAGRWKIVQGEQWLFDFAGSRSEADEALAAIRRFRFDATCYIGRPDPSMVYLKAGTGVPGGASAGLDCLRFDRAAASVRPEGPRWLLASSSRMAMFPDEEEARRALEVINHYDLDRRCFVGRPDPSLEYWLAQ